MSSPWKDSQPELVADKVLRRAEVGKMGRKLKARLALAQFKTNRGWEDLSLDTIEPKMEEELRKRRPTSSGDLLSDSSSSPSEFRYGQGQVMSSPLKGAIFSDAVELRSGGSFSSAGGRRKRNYNSFELPSSGAQSRKRFRSSPVRARQSAHLSWKEDYQLPQSSPIKARKQAHFTTSSGPDLSFYNHPSEDLSSGFTSTSDNEEDALPAHSFDARSSPRTPPGRSRGGLGRRRDKNAKPGDDGADLLLYLATSPSPAKPTSRVRMQPPSTPPPKNQALPSSVMTTPNQIQSLLATLAAPNTPTQSFDFADFVNITPSPAQNGFTKTPRTLQTPLSANKRHLTFDNHNSPNMREHSARDFTSAGRSATGLGGMQLGGDLNSNR